MKTFLTAAVLALAATVAQAGEKTANIFVSGLFCPSCGYIVGSAMKSVASVEILEFKESDDKSTAVYRVKFDDDQASAEQIVEAVFDYGYEARLMDEAES